MRLGAAIVLLAACESSATHMSMHRRDLEFAPFDEDLAVAGDVDLSGAADLRAAAADLAVGDLQAVADQATPNGDLLGTSSCKALLATTPGLPSGTYTITPASGGTLSVFCDMTTDGGGWTMVFKAGTSNYNTGIADYDLPTSSSLWSDATETLIAHRDAANDVVGDWARFAVPADWRVKAPFQYDGQDLTVTVSVSGAAAVSRTLHYGRFNFTAVCTDAWDSAINWGRICIEGTTAPFYDGFANVNSDGCENSAQIYGATLCSVSLLFSIAIR
jgi:Fibrinogen beta and gamma chains, C-terminal globular domain